MGVEVLVTSSKERPRRVPLTPLDNLVALKMDSGSLTAGSANDFCFAWQNPESVQIAVLRVIIDITTAGAATSVIDVGSAANATTHSDNLLDGIDASAVATYNNIDDAGTNGKSVQILDEKGGTTDYVTGQILVADATSLVGTYRIFYAPLSRT
jgi:hypothetical protein